jgi:hypothetical protein
LLGRTLQHNAVGEKPMQSLKLQAHVGADGVLRLELPIGLSNTDVEVLIVLQPMQPTTIMSPTETEKLGWPPGFFEQTYGSLRDELLMREPHGDYELREGLL